METLAFVRSTGAVGGDAVVLVHLLALENSDQRAWKGQES